MTKPLSTSKKTVELRPASRIRRDPVPVQESGVKEVKWQSSEREITVALIGILLFAIAIDIIVLGFSDFLGK